MFAALPKKHSLHTVIEYYPFTVGHLLLVSHGIIYTKYGTSIGFLEYL